MEIFMDYDDAIDIVNQNGMKYFFEYISDQYEDLDLYTMSIDWTKSKQYICKFKGTSGDLLISWN